MPPCDIDTSDISCFVTTPFDFLAEENLLEKHEPLTKAERETLLILEDNKAAVEWAKKPGAGSKMKHLETRLHWIKRAVSDRVIKIHHIPTKEQIADMFTKALAPALFLFFISQFMFYVKH